ncbi:NHL repeat-containing protein [candidate division KSB1 bacterium]
MRYFVLTSLLIIIVGLFIVCGGETKPPETEIIDGVTYIHNENPDWGDSPKVSLKFIQKIGELDHEDNNYLLHKPTDIALDAEGNIYVLDSGNTRIQKYTTDGKYLQTVGKKGDGPGELRMPHSVDVDNEMNIYISDMNKAKVFSPEGREERSIPFGGFLTPFKILSSGDFLSGGGTSGGFASMGSGATMAFSAVSAMPSGGNIVFSGTGSDVSISIGEPESEEDEKIEPKLVKIFDSSGKLKNSFGESLDYNDNMMNSMGNSIYTAFDQENNVFISFQHQNRIEKYSPDGRLLWKADRPLNYEITGPIEEKTMEISESSGDMMISLKMPKINNVSRGIGVDDLKNVWVMTYTKQQEQYDPENPEKERDTKLHIEIEIYDNNGTLLGKLPWEEEFEPTTNCFHMFGDRLFFISTDGVSVYEYKIIYSQ